MNKFKSIGSNFLLMFKGLFCCRRQSIINNSTLIKLDAKIALTEKKLVDEVDKYIELTVSKNLTENVNLVLASACEAVSKINGLSFNIKDNDGKLLYGDNTPECTVNVKLTYVPVVSISNNEKIGTITIIGG